MDEPKKNRSKYRNKGSSGGYHQLSNEGVLEEGI